MEKSQLKAYAGSIARIDLKRKTARHEALAKDMAEEYVGGSGFCARILHQEIDSGALPLGPENKLVFMTGPLTGTATPMTGRHVVAAKSPLTGIWGEADAGGFWGTELKFAKLDGLVIEGASDSPVLIWINDGRIEIKDAKDFWGMDARETAEQLRKDLDQNAKISSIGQAGEKLVKYATIINDFSRTAGRSGLGAVMGSKKLKAIAVRGQSKIEVAQEEELRKLSTEMRQELKGPGGQALHDWGTTGESFDFMLGTGNLPLKNWAETSWNVETVKSLGGKALADTILLKRTGCYNCPVLCERTVSVKEGPYAISGQVRGPEYETIAALGTLCLNGDLKSIAKANDICNRHGIDTIEAGTAIALAIECYDRGLISSKETGRRLTWGDPDAIVELVDKIGRREGFGDILAEGTRSAAERIGKGAPEYAMHVKGSSICMHDPRANPVMALKYAVGNVGAYHGDGCPDKGRTPQDVARALIEGQNWFALYNSLVMCSFAFEGWACALSPEKYVPPLLKAATGKDWETGELMKTAERIYVTKRMFNVKCGVSAKEDKLPARFGTIPRILESGERIVADIDSALLEYYKQRGWDDRGIPVRQKLEELGIRSA